MPEMYSEVCTIELDLYDLARKTRECKKVGPGGRYYLLQYDLALHFGLTELKAQVVYMDEVPGLHSMLRRSSLIINIPGN